MGIPVVRIRERYDFYRGYWEGLTFAKSSKNTNELDLKMRETQAKIDELRFVLKIIEGEPEEEPKEETLKALEG